VMMGPLLVELADAFGTSVVVAGQLAAAIGISWGITAPLVGPVSDIYGRRRVALTGVTLKAAGTLGSLLVWDYWGLLVCRLLTGIGAAMIPPNSMATIADHFAPSERGRPISIIIAVSCLGYVIGLPAVAALGQVGGWRPPYLVVGVLISVLLAWHWLSFPTHTKPTQASGFAAHFKAVGRVSTFWFLLVANVLYRTASFATFTYLTVFLIKVHDMNQGQTALPLAFVGLGTMTGSLLGGYLAPSPQRLAWAACGLIAGGIGLGLAFGMDLLPWWAIALSCIGMVALTIFEPISWVVTAELAGESRATANGLLATSNQIGVIGGASAAGLVLAVGDFPWLGLFCIASALASAIIVMGIGFSLRGIQSVGVEGG
jgi:predicted MFS family arabinose efflux permease